MVDFDALLERIKNATSLDRALDAAVWNALPCERWPMEAYRENDCRLLERFGRSPRLHDGWLIRRREDDQYPEDLPRLTDSLDAVIALSQRVLPDHGWIARTGTPGGDGSGCTSPYGAIRSPDDKGEPVARKYGNTPALALLAALVAAVQSTVSAQPRDGQDDAMKRSEE